MSLFAIAASGLNAAEVRLGVAAQDTAAASPPPAPAQGSGPSAPAPALQLVQFSLPGGGVGTSTQPGGPDDPIGDVVNEIEAVQAFKASLRIFQAGESTSRALLNLKA